MGLFQAKQLIETCHWVKLDVPKNVIRLWFQTFSFHP